MIASVGGMTEGQRSAILDEELLQRVRAGARVQARTATQAVVETGKPVNHVLHLLVSVLLCGMWLPVWVMITASGGTWTRTLTVDEQGEVHDSHDAVARRDRIMMWIGLALIVLVIVAIVVRWS
jgi:hypothetical protein